MVKKCIFTILCICGILAAQQTSLQLGGGVANEGVAPGKTDTRIEYSARSTESGYGYRGYTVPIGLTVLPWALPNQESYVTGLRMNFGWGSYKETIGLDLGLFSAGEEHSVLGINAFGHYSKNDALGCEIGLVNVAGGTMAGLQIGLVNYADTLYGAQIGLINVARTQWSIPIINICW
ncbi:MAG: hypothetical protein IJS08_01575 [Victivallales bacterium]|nr:hypothetical protein [Victivallales bacterium]